MARKDKVATEHSLAIGFFLYLCVLEKWAIKTN
jgi:hypothetical protein